MNILKEICVCLFLRAQRSDVRKQVDLNGQRMFWGVDIKNGTVEYDDISFLPEQFKAKDYVDYLKEDLLQIRFPDGFLIDIGWRPSFSMKGKFYILAVENSNWESPAAQMAARDVLGVKEAMRKMISDLI